MLSFTIGRNTITVFIDGMVSTIDNSHPNFKPLHAELKKPREERDLQNVRDFMSVKAMLASQTFGKVTVSECSVLFEDTLIGSYLADRMLEMFNGGINVAPYAKFMENVMANPAPYVAFELFQWMEKARLPITPDGHFLAFKYVDKNYKDNWTGIIDHSVGAKPKMDREACDPDRNRHCSTGFHFCSPDYLGTRSDRPIMVVKVNPADVTAIPADYSYTKGRCCTYEVVAELTDISETRNPAWTKGVVDVAKMAKKLPIKPKPQEEQWAERDRIGTAREIANGNITQAEADAFHQKKNNKLSPANVQGKTFTTSDGRSFTKKQVKKSVSSNPSIRGAARSLGVGESTLRGWIKKL